jgi:hypothetical protein
MFGGALNQIGWGVFAFGMIFFWVFATEADVRLLGPSGGWTTASGTVSAIEKTGMSENKTQVVRIRYTFRAGKKDFEGASYSLGSSIDVDRT